MRLFSVLFNKKTETEKKFFMYHFGISSDSTCDLKKDYVKSHEIFIAPLRFVMEQNGELFDGVDDFQTYDEYAVFYEKLRAGAFSRTSMLNEAGIYAHFKTLVNTGVKEWVHFSLSSGLSPTAVVAQKAADMIHEKYPDVNIYVVDSLTATVGQGILVKLAVDCREKGMSAEETFEKVSALKNHVQHCIIPDNLNYLKRGGRISSVSAAVGTMLNIKPMLAFDGDGRLKVVEKCKGMKKAFFRIGESVLKAPVDEIGLIVVVHTGNQTGAEELAKLVEEKTGIKPAIEIMGPVIGSHVGPGSVSCAWLSKKTRAELIGE